jgi:hypothetical protein
MATRSGGATSRPAGTGHSRASSGALLLLAILLVAATIWLVHRRAA